MVLTPGLVLLVLALLFVVGNALKKLPAWPAVLCLIVLHLVGR